MASTVSGSARWTHFHSALQLAIQRSAHKWTYEDFTECFSLWCEEEPGGSSAVFNKVSENMETTITGGCEALLNDLDVKSSLDKLHAVVTEARARKKAGEYKGEDVWREDLHPGAAVRAKTVPLLEEERDRLKSQLAERASQLDEKNRALQAEMLANVRAQEAADDEANQLLDTLEEVFARWNDVPMDDIQAWAVETAESTNSVAAR